MENVLESVKKFVIGFLVAIYFIFAFAMTILLLNYNSYGVTQFGDTSVVILSEKITHDEFHKGQIVLVEKVDIKEIEVNQTMFVYRIDETRQPHIQVGTVAKVYPNDNAITLEDGSNYSEDFIAGSPTKVIEKWGTVLHIIESRWGFLFMILVPLFLLFIYEIYTLIVEVKYGDSDEEGEETNTVSREPRREVREEVKKEEEIKEEVKEEKPAEDEVKEEKKEESKPALSASDTVRARRRR